MTRRGRCFRDSRTPQPLWMSTRERAESITPAQKDRNPEPGCFKVPSSNRRDCHRTNRERPKKKRPLLISCMRSDPFYFLPKPASCATFSKIFISDSINFRNSSGSLYSIVKPAFVARPTTSGCLKTFSTAGTRTSMTD